jgi:hypothetical protein
MSENKKDIKMKFVKIGILILVGLDIIFACSFPTRFDGFTYDKKPLKNISFFKTDGYYYSKNCYEEYNSRKVLFLNSNGFLIIYTYNPYTIDPNLIDLELDSAFSNKKTLRQTLQNRGAFSIENDSVTVQTFYCEFGCWVKLNKGKILNDSTLLFGNPVYNEKNKDKYPHYDFYEKCDTFYFRKLNWKPDSTYQIGFEKELKKHKYKF